MAYLIEQITVRCAQKRLAASRPPDDQGARRSHRAAGGRFEAQRRKGRQSHKGYTPGAGLKCQSARKTGCWRLNASALVGILP
jgi:hypothetical protein